MCLPDADTIEKTIGYVYAVSQIQHLQKIL
jgi:hypothetical protein